MGVGALSTPGLQGGECRRPQGHFSRGLPLSPLAHLSDPFKGLPANSFTSARGGDVVVETIQACTPSLEDLHGRP